MVGKVVGEVENAFIKDRYILDGVLIANEIMDYLKKVRKKTLIFKVNFEKSSDSLNWEFLMEIMGCMGFGIKWRKWIKSCLCSSSISLLMDHQ